MIHPPRQQEQRERIGSAIRQHREALVVLARTLNGAPLITPDQLDGLSEPVLEFVILDDADFCFHARVIAARVYLERLLQRMGPPPDDPRKSGLRRRIPEGILEGLEGGSPQRKAEALVTVREEMIRWMWDLREGRDPVSGCALSYKPAR